MEVNQLVAHYKANYERKVFMTRLSHAMQNAYLMYIYDYPSELKNFADTFLAYLPFYIRNSDYFETVDENEDIDTQLIARSKNMRKNSKIIPHRQIASDGIYGELFLDFYLRIVNGRKAVITYANKRSFDSNYESTGPDNIVYFLDENKKINICFCEAKFVAGAANAKNNLIEDIVGKPNTPGKADGKPAHISAAYLNDYFQFIVEKGNAIQEPDKTIFKSFFTDLNAQLDGGNDFVSVLIAHNIAHLEKTYSIDDAYEWKIISALKKGVGIYISPLPRYIKREIINLFEDDVIGTLIVTTSFTEGVNTSASNLIFTSLINGPTTNRLSDIDVLNVSGRAGRFARNSIGKVYCITSEVYEKVTQLQREAQIRLENYNYCTQGHKRIDYEIDMIEDEYLSEAEREEKSKTLEEMLALGLTADDMRLSLNVSTKWKVALYKYFRLHPEQVTTSYEKAKDILEAQPKARIESLNYIFHILKAAFEAANIDGFECEPYEIRAFDSQNNFIWGRLYRVYCSGKIANVISSNRKYITGRYEDFIKEHNLTRIKEKRVMQQYFNEEKLGWILRYYKSDLTPNIDAFYSETFKFISSIIQYKIPFYTSFFVSILKLFLQKNALDASLNLSCLDAKKITLLFEDGSVYDDYSKLIDYGVSNDLVMKLHDGHITIAELQEERYDKSIFDEYEQLMLSDFLSIL